MSRLLGSTDDPPSSHQRDDRFHGGRVATPLRFGIGADGCEEREKLVAEQNERGQEERQNRRRVLDDTLDQGDNTPDARVQTERVHRDQLEVVLENAKQCVPNRRK